MTAAATDVVVEARPSRRRNSVIALLGLFGFVVSFAASWVPSYWSDEVATVRAASISPSDLLHFVSGKDAVHASYYTAMHFWSLIAGSSELALRFPSAIAVGVATAGVAMVGRQLHNDRLGIVAAILFALLPRTTYMGAEARSYAMTAAAAVVLTAVLLHARRSARATSWVAYGLLAAASIVLFAYLGLILAAHVVTLLALRGPRRVVVRFAISCVVATGVCLPFLVLVAGQKGQIAWLGSQPTFTVWTVLVEPWFEASVASAILCWLLLVVACARWRAMRDVVGAEWLVVSVAWVVVPTALLVVANVAFGPLYTSRYLSFTAPGMALLLAAALTAVPWRHAVTVGAAVLVIVALPNYVAQRGPVAKNGGSDLRQIAQTVAAHAHAGDAVAFQNASTPALHPRQALYGYPSLFAHLRDVSLVTAFPATGTFSDQTLDVQHLAPRLVGVDTLWFVTANLVHDCSAVPEESYLAADGFVAGHAYPVSRTTVCEFRRQ